MSDYKEYLSEREQIDLMFEKGYFIKNVQENLSGAIVTFEKNGSETETLHIKTADARKYFSNLLLATSKRLIL
ncbi:hypothetical protein [Pseudalkalibacillus salsuginis]|uniref:hypothetical protein n=1 Tax=Pseudalkalibacillus salsuginis TaxID=2910972 RepID=UPI001F2AF115|nr:hypothetical protein [Pseudalkalibacillus salsuginis]MCF6408991.1 hypothetical protein [Pseudalkalibacillus salsuginis]